MTKTRIWAVPAMAVLLVLSLSAFGLGDYREEFSKTLSLKAGQTFALDNVNGDVTLSTWKEDKVEIKAVKTAKDSEKDLKEVEIRVEESAGTVSVKTIWPEHRRNFRVSVDFEVKVPEGVNLKGIETVNGDVTVTGAYGSAKLETTNGTIEADSFTGALDVETTNGDIKVRRLDGRLDAETTNGGIRIEELSFKDGARAETTNGSIELAVKSPEKINAVLRAETTNGSLRVDFPVTLQNLNKSEHHLEAQLGQGGPEIELSTTNGSIIITK